MAGSAMCHTTVAPQHAQVGHAQTFPIGETHSDLLQPVPRAQTCPVAMGLSLHAGERLPQRHTLTRGAGSTHRHVPRLLWGVGTSPASAPSLHVCGYLALLDGLMGRQGVGSYKLNIETPSEH